ncbi:MAG: type IV pilus modification protein PilV [Burkholderiales bacterium]
MLSAFTQESTMRHKAQQRGIILLEALVGILIFSIGILAMIALQATAIKNQADAKYRADASYLADQIMSTIWVDRPNIATYQHRVTGGGPSCNPSGANSAAANVTAWLAKVLATLPGAAGANQQIIVGAGNQVTVTVCWRGPQETTWHNYVVTTFIN